MANEKVSGLEWTGEPKDLFDVDLLLSKPDLDAGTFQKSLLAVGNEDKLEWLAFDLLIKHAPMMDGDCPNWSTFQAQHTNLDMPQPVVLFKRIADRLGPLLGDFYLPAEIPFLRAIHAERMDEFNLLIYSDWLDENGHEHRSDFLRQFTRFHFHEDQRAGRERNTERELLLASLRETSLPWLNLLFGTAARLREVVKNLERTDSVGVEKRPWWRLW